MDCILENNACVCVDVKPCERPQSTAKKKSTVSKVALSVA